MYTTAKYRTQSSAMGGCLSNLHSKFDHSAKCRLQKFGDEGFLKFSGESAHPRHDFNYLPSSVNSGHHNNQSGV